MNSALNTAFDGRQDDAFIRKVDRTMTRHRMLVPGLHVLVAVSGGADSVALLHALNCLKERHGLQLGVAHLNHGLRGDDANGDAAFVAELARQLNLPLFSTCRDTRSYARQACLALEEAGRHLRYAFFEACTRQHGFQRIALAHHRDDNAEQILMNLMRGSGGRGLAGIPPVRDKIIRPLMDQSRRNIMAFIQKHGFMFRTDASNRDLRFLRNRIRRHLLPLMRRGYNPSIVEVLNRSAQINREEEVWLDSMIIPLYNDLIIHKAPDCILLHSGKLVLLPKPAARRVLRQAIMDLKGDLRRIGLVHIESILALNQSSRHDGTLDLPGQVRISKQSAGLFLIREKLNLRQVPVSNEAAFKPEFAYQVLDSQSPAVLEVPEIGRRLQFEFWNEPDNEPDPAAGRFSDASEAWLDLDRLQFPLAIRNVRPQDRFRPLGMQGHKPVRRFIREQAVGGPATARDAVLTSAASVVWVVGRRIAEDVKINPHTRRVLHITSSVFNRQDKYNYHNLEDTD